MSATKIVRNVAIVGGLACAAIANATPYLLRRNIQDSNAYKSSMRLLKSNQEAIKHMGEPIEAGTIKPMNTKENTQKDNDYKFTIPVRGPKGEGKLRYLVSVSGEEPNLSYDLKTVELTLDKFPDHKLILKHPE